MANDNYDGGVIRWEDPPPRDQGGHSKPRAERRPWALVARQLQDRPGQFALVDVGNSSIAARINRGVTWFSPPGAFEAVSRVVNKEMHVYARYVGPDAQ